MPRFLDVVGSDMRIGPATTRFAVICVSCSSRGVAVFVDETAEQSCPVDGEVVGGRDRLGWGRGWSWGQGQVWALTVEMALVDLQDGFQEALREDQ
jgi:hypothetical protein